MRNYIFTLLFIVISFQSEGQVSDSTMTKAQETFLKATIESLDELMVKGLEMHGDSVVASEEFKRLLDDQEYRNLVYPSTYTWEQALNFMSAMELKKAFWFFINLYPQNDANKEMVLKIFLSYDQVLKIEDAITNTFNTYCFADPAVSIIKEGDAEIMRPDIMEAKLRDVQEIIAYIHAYREQSQSEKD